MSASITFIDAKKKFAQDRRELIYQDLAKLPISEAERQNLAQRITSSMAQYDEKNFTRQGSWIHPSLTDC